MRDITSRQDIELLVDAFYKQVLKDDMIAHFFTEVVKLDWGNHIPVMYDFWETTLLGNIVYKGNPMIKHLHLNEQEMLLPEHFERWLYLWETTIVNNFSGPKATEAIERAKQIAGIMQFKVRQSSIG